jgi:NAD(P)-dependent dehydrogenase (short-subunit alcohol dehydrogenase family)
LGAIDILVNNAGIAATNHVHDISIDEWDRMIAVHLRSVFLATRLVLPMMYRQNSGKIVNTASQLAYKASPGLPQPQAAKIFRTPATSADPPAKRMSWPDFGDQEYAITLTRNDMTYQFLGLAVSVYLRGIDQRHAQRNAFAQRFFLVRFRVSSLAQTRRTLTERRDDGSVMEFDSSFWAVWNGATGRSRFR